MVKETLKETIALLDAAKPSVEILETVRAIYFLLDLSNGCIHEELEQESLIELNRELKLLLT